MSGFEPSDVQLLLFIIAIIVFVLLPLELIRSRIKQAESKILTARLKNSHEVKSQHGD